MTVQAPPPDFQRYWWPDLVDFVGRVNRAYAEVPFSATSWWRSEADNSRVGGARFSQHLIGTGVDLVASNPYSNHQLANALRRQGLVVVATYPRHVHAQLYQAGFLQSWLGA